jgi:hypothetical protein
MNISEQSSGSYRGFPIKSNQACPNERDCGVRLLSKVTVCEVLR